MSLPLATYQLLKERDCVRQQNMGLLNLGLYFTMETLMEEVF